MENFTDKDIQQLVEEMSKTENKKIYEINPTDKATRDAEMASRKKPRSEVALEELEHKELEHEKQERRKVGSIIADAEYIANAEYIAKKNNFSLSKKIKFLDGLIDKYFPYIEKTIHKIAKTGKRSGDLKFDVRDFDEESHMSLFFSDPEVVLTVLLNRLLETHEEIKGLHFKVLYLSKTDVDYDKFLIANIWWLKQN